MQPEPHHIEFFKHSVRKAQLKQMNGASTIPIKTIKTIILILEDITIIITFADEII